MKNMIGIGTTLVGIMIGGLAYWFQPYNQSTVFGINMWVFMCIGVFLGTLLLMIFLNEKTPKIALFVSLGVILAVSARIIYDTTFWDSTSHNLFPFEILFSAIATVPCAFTGSYLGLLIKKFFRLDEEWGTRGVSEGSLPNFENDVEINANIKNTSSPAYITYSVLYGTNRKYEIELNKIDYKNTRDNNLHIGTSDISIPLSHKKGDLERPDWFGSLFFDESPEKHFTILKTELFDKIKFINILQEKIGNSDQKDILLFIHGFNVDFKEAMLRTAQLGYDLNFKGGVTVFSWPSDGSVSGYLADTDTARLSAKYLCDFIKILLSPTGVKNLHIIAHSMGNVVLTDALIQLKYEGLFPNALINQIILAAPDLDKDIFINRIMPEINRNFGLTLYASDKDKALISSKQIRKGFTRLGEGGDNIVLVDGLDTVDASRIDTSLLGHGYFADTQPLLNDIHMTLSGLPPSSRTLDSKSKVVEGATKSYWII